MCVTVNANEDRELPYPKKRQPKYNECTAQYIV